MKQQVKPRLLKPNPDNPRFIRDAKYKELKESMASFPKMQEFKPIVVDENMMVLAGNMRLKVARELKWETVWIDDLSGWTEEEKREFIIRDNTHAGEWDMDDLANKYSVDELKGFGLELPGLYNELSEDVKEEREELFGEEWFVNVECVSEKEANVLFTELKERGLIVKIVR